MSHHNHYHYYFYYNSLLVLSLLLLQQSITTTSPSCGYCSVTTQSIMPWATIGTPFKLSNLKNLDEVIGRCRENLSLCADREAEPPGFWTRRIQCSLVQHKQDLSIRHIRETNHSGFQIQDSFYII